MVLDSVLHRGMHPAVQRGGAGIESRTGMRIHWLGNTDEPLGNALRCFMGAISNSALVVRSLSASGAWSILDTKPADVRRLAVSADAARESAAEMLRRHRITHVVLNLKPDFADSTAMQSIASDPKAWGLRKTFVDRTATLYEVESPPVR